MPHRTMFLAGCLATVALGACVPAEATTMLFMNDRDLVGQSTSIVYGEVMAVSSSFLTGRKVIYTTARVRVIEVDKGARVQPGSTMMVRTLGGSIGKIHTRPPGLPTYRPGERVYLFLAPDRGGVDQALNGVQGKLTVHTDPASGEEYVLSGFGQGDAPADGTISPAGAGQAPPSAFSTLADEKSGRIPLPILRHHVRAVLADIEASGPADDGRSSRTR